MTATLPPTYQQTRPGAVPNGRRVLPADTDRTVWLRHRRDYLCSSDIAAVLGVNDYNTALHVYHDKHGNLPTDDNAGEPALWGTLLEGVVAQEWARRNRAVIRRIGLVANVDRPWQACTLDRQVIECPLGQGPCALEVKTRNAWVSKKWRREVPDDVLAQVVWAMETCGYLHMHVACLIGGNDYRQFVVRRDPELAADMVTAGQRFWHDHVQAGIPPKVDGPADPLIDLDNRLHPDRHGLKPLDSMDDMGEALDALGEYERGRLIEKAGRRRKTAAKARLVGLLEGHEMALIEGHPAFTYEAHTREDIDVARLRDEHPDVYRQVRRLGEVRTLRVAKPHRLPDGFIQGDSL